MICQTRTIVRCLGCITLEGVLYVLSVALLLYATSLLFSFIPFGDITTTPETTVVNKLGLSAQSLKYILFEEELFSLYAPSPPPLLFSPA